MQVQNINLSYGICISLGTIILKCQTLLVACATDDSNVQLYIANENDDTCLIKSEILRGHDDWVRGIAFTHFGKIYFHYKLIDLAIV